MTRTVPVLPPYSTRAPLAPLPHEQDDQVESYLADQRAEGIRRALDYLVAGQLGRARYELQRSVQRQARIAGLGTLPVVVGCPCGREHESGGVSATPEDGA